MKVNYREESLLVRSSVRGEMPTEDRLLTVNEVAELMRVSNMTIYRLIKAGEINATRVGRSYRLRQRDVDEYLTKGTAR
jgi:excisionase family DNA binding protein